jgi:hypothetical protein
VQQVARALQQAIFLKSSLGKNVIKLLIEEGYERFISSWPQK